MEPDSGLRLLEDREGISTFLLIIVDRPPGVDPVTKLQHPPEFIRFACDNFFKEILISKSLQSRIVVILDGRKNFRRVKRRSDDCRGYNRFRS